MPARTCASRKWCMDERNCPSSALSSAYSTAKSGLRLPLGPPLLAVRMSPLSRKRIRLEVKKNASRKTVGFPNGSGKSVGRAEPTCGGVAGWRCGGIMGHSLTGSAAATEGRPLPLVCTRGRNGAGHSEKSENERRSNCDASERGRSHPVERNKRVLTPPLAARSKMMLAPAPPVVLSNVTDRRAAEMLLPQRAQGVNAGENAQAA
jgi:hypothetical protein